MLNTRLAYFEKDISSQTERLLFLHQEGSHKANAQLHTRQTSIKPSIL